MIWRLILEEKEPPILDPWKAKEKQEMKKWDKPLVKSEKKEPLIANVTPFKIVLKIEKKEDEKVNGHQVEKNKKQLTRRDMEEKEYPFLVSDYTTRNEETNKAKRTIASTFV